MGRLSGLLEGCLAGWRRSPIGLGGCGWLGSGFGETHLYTIVIVNIKAIAIVQIDSELYCISLVFGVCNDYCLCFDQYQSVQL